MPAAVRRSASVAVILAMTIVLGACQSSTSVASQAPSPSPAASTGADTSTWSDYTSDELGFTLQHPADWSAFPEGGRIFFSGGATWTSGVTVGRYATDGADPAAWIEAHCGRVIDLGVNRPDEADGLVSCDVPLDSWTPTSVDGRPASMDASDEGCCIDTVVFTDDAAYVITAWAGTAADRPLVDAFLSTIRLQP